MTELLDEAAKELAPARLEAGGVRNELFVQMCYPGQNFDMSVPVPEGVGLEEGGLLDLAGRFHDKHEAERGFAFRSQQPLLRGVRLVATGVTPKPPSLAARAAIADGAAHTGSRPVYFGEGFVDTPIYDGTAMAPGTRVAGPALIEEPFTVVVLSPGDTCTLDHHGNYDITVAAP
jgi:N-methylhydantoinase A